MLATEMEGFLGLPRHLTFCLTVPENSIKRLLNQNGYTGKEVKTMCCKPCCEQPEKLKGKPGECTPAQIKECHGDVKKHPCEGEKKEGK